ncbi:M48 family metallopeptidase [Lutimaribacter marinistellae]|uniref:M48 family metallopeptidase n=1 Tax=Lutimaribacter marinistellae TaxID=1820329 RepID=A0ABV7TER8_9RHOB
MGTRYLNGNPLVAITLRRTARARRISLRISQVDGRVTLTLPPYVAERDALKFAREKEEWIRHHLGARPPVAAVGPGGSVPVEGVERRIVATSGRRITLGQDEIAVPVAGAARRLERFLRELARDRLVAACDLYSVRLGLSYARITLRDTRSRWGSCSSEGALMFSWRLILAPPDVLAYVAAHEVAHLAEMNHSPRFWAQVERIHGPYGAQRAWLRAEGSALHRYRFDVAD